MVDSVTPDNCLRKNQVKLIRVSDKDKYKSMDCWNRQPV